MRARTVANNYIENDGMLFKIEYNLDQLAEFLIYYENFFLHTYYTTFLRFPSANVKDSPTIAMYERILALFA